MVPLFQAAVQRDGLYSIQSQATSIVTSGSTANGADHYISRSVPDDGSGNMAIA